MVLTSDPVEKLGYEIRAMSKEALEIVIGKALVEIEFRKALLADPDLALAGFDLSEAEQASLKRMDSESLEALARALQRRPG